MFERLNPQELNPEESEQEKKEPKIDISKISPDYKPHFSFSEAERQKMMKEKNMTEEKIDAKEEEINKRLELEKEEPRYH